MNLTLTSPRSVVLPLGFATAVVLSSVLLSMAASLALTARHEPVPPPPPVLAPVSPAPAGDTGVPDASTALHAVHETVAEPAPTF